MKIGAEDRWFSLCVRQRSGWKCECCGKVYESGSQGLHCSHFFSRTKRTTRWHPLNAAAHCMGCHRHLGGNPILFQSWIESHLGKTDYLMLLQMAGKTAKFRKADLKDIARHYKAQHENQLKQVGYVGFEISPIIEAKLLEAA